MYLHAERLLAKAGLASVKRGYLPPAAQRWAKAAQAEHGSLVRVPGHPLRFGPGTWFTAERDGYGSSVLSNSGRY